MFNFRLRNVKGRPPASPQLRPRRVAEIQQQQPAAAARSSVSRAPPSRTHSLEDILDREDEAAVVKACEKYLSATELSAAPAPQRTAPPLQRGVSLNAAGSEEAAPQHLPSAHSDSAFCLDEPKRKRNFMDKCVNKVRSFIKK